MAISFPTNPNLGDRFLVDRTEYVYDGSSWTKYISTPILGRTGQTGSSLPGYTGSSGGSAGSVIQTDVYTVSGSPHTWVKNNSASIIRIIAIGGGGGGASGGSDGVSTIYGGGGGGAGTIVHVEFPASLVNYNETVTVAVGGAGANAFHANGSYGGNTSFGNHVIALGGLPGLRGGISLFTQSRYNLFRNSSFRTAPSHTIGSSSAASSGYSESLNLQCPTGGGGGGSASFRSGARGGFPGNNTSNGENAWRYIFPANYAQTTLGSTSAGTNGNAGTTCGIVGIGGAGGGSSTSTDAGNAGDGGAGGFPGGGGGGGGSDGLTDTGGHGFGGAGGDGLCIVFQYV